MKVAKKSVHKSAKTVKYQPLTVGSVTTASGMQNKIDVNARMKVSTYFKTHGVPSLGQALEAVEHNLAK